jgi:hypothetical protein
MQLHHEMRQAAEGFARQLARTGVELSFDREGVVAMDGYVDSNRTLWSEGDCARLGSVIAAFVGECMAETYGLEWRASSDGSAALGLPYGGDVSPRSTVQARLDGGPTLVSWFDEVGMRIATGER